MLQISEIVKKTEEMFDLINFPGASTQTPQGRLPPASQERGISPNLATLGASLYAPRGGECTHSHSISISTMENLPARQSPYPRTAGVVHMAGAASMKSGMPTADFTEKSTYVPSTLTAPLRSWPPRSSMK